MLKEEALRPMSPNSSVSSSSNSTNGDHQKLRQTIELLEDIIRLNNSKQTPSNDDLNRINVEMTSISYENIKLQEDLRKREETIQNLILNEIEVISTLILLRSS